MGLVIDTMDIKIFIFGYTLAEKYSEYSYAMTGSFIIIIFKLL